MADPVLRSFAPIVDDACRVLVLGTMPGALSLQRKQYYGHPRNAFWPILSSLLAMDPGEGYEARCRTLLRHHIALWDVLGTCRRAGSADAGIREERPNDIPGLLRDHPLVGHIYFNGAAAERLFSTLVKPRLPLEGIRCERLPSTSPANTLPFQAKLAAWSVILQPLKM